MGVVSCGTTMLDQGVFENIGAVTWDTTVKTSGFTAVSGNGYFCNTTSAAFTVTLPSSPSAGDIVGIKDYANTADTNNITIGRNGSNIQGIAADFVISTEGGSVLLVYIDGTKGWLVTSASQASDIVSPGYIVATGGTITTSGDYKIHSFTGPGTFTVCSVGNPAGSITVDYLVTAGGGGGGITCAGGGGAGGYRESFPNPGAGGFPVSATGYPITIGGGGAGAPPEPATKGSNSIFSTITSTGGGYGGAPAPGGPGGSGGGSDRGGGAGGTGNSPPVSPSQGNNGGAGAPNGANYGGGGGGGASAVGANGTSSVGGNGGAGTASSITGSSVTRAGGGGGGKGSSGTAGTGGAGGGGNGGVGLPTPNPSGISAGTANTGGGGGGAGGTSGVAVGTGFPGGSGIVIIRYKFQQVNYGCKFMWNNLNRSRIV